MRLIPAFLPIAALIHAQSWTTPAVAEVDAIYPDIESLYIDLHRNPELAFNEIQTAAKEWAPEREPTLKAAIQAETTELLELFKGK